MSYGGDNRDTQEAAVRYATLKLKTKLRELVKRWRTMAEGTAVYPENKIAEQIGRDYTDCADELERLL